MLRLLTVAALLHLYVGLRLVPDLAAAAGLLPALLLAAWLTLSAIAMPLALLSRPMPSPRRERLAWTGFLMMGAFSFLWVLCVLRDLGLLLAGALSLAGDGPFATAGTTAQAWAQAGSSSASWLQQTAPVFIPLLALAACAVGLQGARRLPRVRRVRIALPGLPAPLAGLRIVQISDVHVGPTIGRAWVDRLVPAINALQADIVAITGDLVDGTVEQLRDGVAPLAGLRARHGTFFVTGNHEYYAGAAAWIDELRRLGITVLLNEHVLIRQDGAALVLAGITDFSAAHFDPAQASDPRRALSGAPAGAPCVLLAHQPRSCFTVPPGLVQLQLSGHTHGGQFLPWPLFVRLQQPFTAGLHRHGDLQVYVSRGTGYWGPPLRLGAPAEITLVELQPA